MSPVLTKGATSFSDLSCKGISVYLDHEELFLRRTHGTLQRTGTGKGPRSFELQAEEGTPDIYGKCLHLNVNNSSKMNTVQTA